MDQTYPPVKITPEIVRRALTEEDPYSDLIKEYEAYIEAQGLPSMSADELVYELCELPRDQRSDELNAQIDWLSAFIARWEAVE